jgi:hypothetical protein
MSLLLSLVVNLNILIYSFLNILLYLILALYAIWKSFFYLGSIIALAVYLTIFQTKLKIASLLNRLIFPKLSKS